LETNKLFGEVSRRTFLQGALGAGISTRLGATGLSMAATAKTPLNILYIHSHDSGRYLQPFGHAVPTPTLTKLAGEGVIFRKAFCAAPTCSPSRACLLTGQSAHENGMVGLAHLGFKLRDYRKTLIQTLKDSGYATILGGLQHIAPNTEMIGYDQILAHKNASAVQVAPAVVSFLNTRPKVPFFLDVGFFETHRSYPGQPNGYADVTPLDNPNYVLPPAPLPDTPKTRKDIAGYYASARVLDQGIASVLSALQANGYAENTLVISTTDHGISFPGMKCNLNDSGIGVSLIMRGPGGFSGGKVCDAMVSHLDVFPTLCELIGIRPPAWLEGKSLLPVVRGEKGQINDEIFAEVNYHAAYEPKRAVRTERWKYIRRYDGRKTAVLPNCDDGWSKTEWLDHGWQANPLETEEGLYDLIFDPNEHNNLAISSNYQAVLAEMRGRLDRWMKRTDDPLLLGPIPLPQGARASDPNTVRISMKD
jgi:arylsulfatase A-like enzyme